MGLAKMTLALVPWTIWQHLRLFLLALANDAGTSAEYNTANFDNVDVPLDCSKVR